MKTKHSLIDIIVALYYNTIIDQGEDYLNYLLKITEKIDLPDSMPDIEGLSSQNAPLNLKNRIIDAIVNKKGDIDRTYLLMNIRLDVGDDDAIYQALKFALEQFDKSHCDNEEFQKTFMNIRNRINEFNRSLDFSEIVKKAYRTCHNGSLEDIRKQIRTMQDEIEKLSVVKKEGKHPALMNEVNYDKIDTVKESFNQMTDASIFGKPFKLGFSGMQDMLGEAEGLRPGECVMIAADSHNFKSGLLMHLIRMVMQYNRPIVNEEMGKPTIVSFSLENETRTDNIAYYRMFKALEGEVIEKKDIDPIVASEYLVKKFADHGWTFILRRYDPTKVTITDLLNEVEELRLKGHDVKAFFLDYLAMIEDRSDLKFTNVTGADQRALFRKARSYCSPRGILFVTPHQLSSKVKDFIEKGNSSSLLVKEIQNLAMYDGGKAIRQEVDLELIIHLEKREIGDITKTYLTCARGKHRDINNTPDSKKFFAMEFEGKLGLLDDLDAPKFIRKLPGNMGGFINADSMKDLF